MRALPPEQQAAFAQEIQAMIERQARDAMTLMTRWTIDTTGDVFNNKAANDIVAAIRRAWPVRVGKRGNNLHAQGN